MNIFRFGVLMTCLGIATAASAGSTDNGNLWLGTGITYEVVQDGGMVTPEFGFFGFSGFGMAGNFYITGGKQQGLMASARFGVVDFQVNNDCWFNQLTQDGDSSGISKVEVAGNVLLSYVGNLGSGLRLRLGGGIGFTDSKTVGIFGQSYGIYPVAELSLGVRF